MVTEAASEAGPGDLVPASVGEAVEAMRALSAERRPVVFAGGETEPWPEPPPTSCAVLRTSRLDRIREHAPADQIVAVEAGLTLAALQRHLAPHGQRLALDPPLPERATLGGILSAGSFGPRRTRHGSIRDLVIGITLVRADGAVAHGGGKVVKNVAGFDLPRLLCGSAGTLALVAEVVLRLHPLPEVSETVTVDGLDAAGALALSRAARDEQLEPAAVAALAERGRFRLAVRFEGFGPGVRGQVERFLSGAARGERAERHVGGDEALLWAGHDLVRTAGDVRAKATFLPASGGRAMASLRPLAETLSGGGMVYYPTLGIAFVTGTLVDARAAAEAVASARREVAQGNGAVVLSAVPPALRARSGILGPPPPAVELLRRLKAAFDPEGRIAPGRLF